MESSKFNLLYPDSWRIAGVLMLAALGDFLFYRTDAQCGSAIYLIFYAAMIVLTIPENLKSISVTERVVLALLLAGNIWLLLFSPDFTSIMFSLATLAAMRISALTGGTKSFLKWTAKMAVFFFSFPFDFIFQIREAAETSPKEGRLKKFFTGVGLWILPVFITLVFLILFCGANPIMDKYAFILFNKILHISFPAPERLFTWIFLFFFGILFTSGAILRLTFRNSPSSHEPEKDPIRHDETQIIKKISDATGKMMLRGLILFNLLFLAQNVMDIVYLWNSAGLPEGITYASYAQRGAYPLMVTALLAGFMTLSVFSLGNNERCWKISKVLVVIWLVQNAFLMASAILRLSLYINAYSLSLWRAAALLWLGLVGTGLLLIAIKIFFNLKLNTLVWMNICAVAVLLFFTGSVDMKRFVADYNLEHCRENPKGKGAPLDLGYMKSLGIPALPALVKAEKMKINNVNKSPLFRKKIDMMEKALEKGLSSWRTWTLKDFLIRKAVEDIGKDD